MIRSVAVALLALVLIVGQASAECTWVLWTRDSALDKTGAWGYTALGPEFFGIRDECEKVILMYRTNRLKSYEEAKNAGIKNPIPPASAYQCLPDTWDPRGPKGSGR